MKCYILCPYVQTGGPEAMHQLCNEINRLSTATAYMVYLNKPRTAPAAPAAALPLPLLYADDYPHLKEAAFTEIEDDSTHMIILPEIYTKRQLPPFCSIRVAIWWLSINNALQFNTFYENLKQPDAIHLFQSEYASETVLNHSPAIVRKFMLHDYTRPLALPAPSSSSRRANKIAYNPTKDTMLPTLVHPDYLVPLIGLSKKELHTTLQGCKLYIDLGSHPGQDRLPREAAMAGCVVITNKAGAASNAIDIPIEEKVEDSAALFQLIQRVFENGNENYEYYYKKQEPYRISIANEKERFIDEVRRIINKN